MTNLVDTPNQNIASLFNASPSYVMNAQGEAQAILLDIVTWQKILELLETFIDQQFLQQARLDLQQLAQGKIVMGWKNGAEFETELNALKEELLPVSPPVKRSLWGLCADLGPAPSDEDIADMRREAWANFPREDIV